MAMSNMANIANMSTPFFDNISPIILTKASSLTSGPSNPSASQIVITFFKNNWTVRAFEAKTDLIPFLKK